MGNTIYIAYSQIRSANIVEGKCFVFEEREGLVKDLVVSLVLIFFFEKKISVLNKNKIMEIPKMTVNNFNHCHERKKCNALRCLNS